MKKFLFSLSFFALSQVLLISQISMNWSPAGPILSTGRARAMLIDKSDPSKKTLYLASVTSGLFKSVDYGANWSQVNLQDPVRNISYIAQAADNTIYASTGEGFLRPSQLATSLPGTGLYKLNPSTNLLTLVASSAVVGTRITRIACHPTNAQMICVASELGIFLSTDGGNTWTACSGAIPTGTPGYTCEFDAAGNLYATAGSSVSVQLYKSSGANPSGFSLITPTSSALPVNNFSRIEIDFANGGNTIYASCAYPTYVAGSSLAGLFVSYDGGNTWQLAHQGSVQQDPLSSNGSSKTGPYFNVCKVNPLNSNKVFIAGFTLQQWTKTSSNPVSGTWQTFGSPFFFQTPLYLPQNITDIDFEISNGSITKYYILTEAGLYRSIDGLLSFQPFFKGINTSQFSSIGILRDPLYELNGSTINPYTDFVAGTIGNGIIYFSGKYPQVTKEEKYSSGDFFGVQVSNISSKLAYFSPSNSNIYLTSNITSTEPDAIYAYHQATVCGAATPPAYSSLTDYRGITNRGGITEAIYSNNNYTVSGTPVKLWEGFGQTIGSNTIQPTDPVIFFNDSISIITPLTSSTQTSFTIDLPKPQSSAIIDKIVIRTFTTCYLFCNSSNVPSTPCLTVAVNPTVFTKAVMEFSNTSPTVTSNNYTLTNLTSTTLNAVNNLTYNSVSKSDVIKFQILQNPIAAASITNSALFSFFRVGVTVFYHYPVGSKIKVSSSNIPGYTFQDSTTLSSPVAWSFTNTASTSIIAASDPTLNPAFKFNVPISARLAIASSNAILVNKRPLNTTNPMLLQAVSCVGAITTSSTSANAGTITPGGIPKILEWAPDGRSLYYVSTSTASTTYSLYKVYVGPEIYDFSLEDYKGLFYTGAVNGVKQGLSSNNFTYSTNTLTPFRTTLLETFTDQVTSLSVSDNSDALLVTCIDGSGNPKVYYTSGVNTLMLEDNSVIFSDKTGNLPAGLLTYCSLFELSDNKRILIGTNKGVYATNDITQASPTWNDVNNNSLPAIQVLDIKQQKLPNWQAYNSGIIYVATNGAGAWINKQFHNPSVQSVQDNEIHSLPSSLHIFPNPAGNSALLRFTIPANEELRVDVFDIQGKNILSQKIGNYNPGYHEIQMNTSLLDNGIYIIRISGNQGSSRTGKLIVQH